MSLCEEKIYIHYVSYTAQIFLKSLHLCIFFPEEGKMNIWLPAYERGCTNAFTEPCIYLINSEYASLAMKTRAFAKSAAALFNTALQRDQEL